MQPALPYTIFPLGDSAITVDFGNRICEENHVRVLNLYSHLREHGLPGMTEALPAYSSLTVFYQPLFFTRDIQSGRSAYERMKEGLEQKIRLTAEQPAPAPGKLLEVPVCYDELYAMDMAAQSARLGLSPEEIIRIHLSGTYTVYMLGFMPGFSYMGEVDGKIAMPRKVSPVMVEPGSVGIAGTQTGIYPFHSPGGWNIIGRTPITLFNPEAAETVLFRIGDRVKFYRITQHEFENYQGGHTG